MLDSVREVHTPEGVALRLPAAGPVPRAIAWGIDFAIRLGLVIAAGSLLSFLEMAGYGVYLVVLFGIAWAYPVVCEGLFNGQTPGKRVMELRVVAQDGGPIGWVAAFARNLLRTVDMLPFGYATGLVTSLADPWGRRLGDIVARTLVVHVARERKRPPLAEAPPHGVGIVLRPAEQAAVIAFAERAPTLTPERQAELADLVEPMTQARGAEGVERLFGLANWLLGRR
ncbi:RDD family protein [Lysobacter helvus]|uniref:RDD family protein n=2 Tax=Lysobacteraceae TaxID=32033 RepID=A0ABN6FRQ0_9GAMM|nr:MULTISPECIES: RDD family protein [Lysobacter]BCT92146.1 RDD family protein [Lysobacter caseinilyticus]BCT95299.1 RDD family protein [Lysobacter helvus]